MFPFNYVDRCISRNRNGKWGRQELSPVGCWAGKRRVPASSDGRPKIWREKIQGVPVAGDVPVHFQVPAEVPFSKVPNPYVGVCPAAPICSWDRLRQPPCDPVREMKQIRKWKKRKITSGIAAGDPEVPASRAIVTETCTCNSVSHRTCPT